LKYCLGKKSALLAEEGQPGKEEKIKQHKGREGKERECDWRRSKKKRSAIHLHVFGNSPKKGQGPAKEQSMIHTGGKRISKRPLAPGTLKHHDDTAVRRGGGEETCGRKPRT